jgi:outer membrane biogenesis lipoprotein LolB
LRELTIILVLIILSSCSVLRKERSDNDFTEHEVNLTDIVERIRKQNISNQNFYISKAEIEVTSGEDRQSFIASFKFLFPDKYLISLRSKSGIEGARIFVTGDTLILNDRINRKLYYGKPDYIRKKFGISSSGLPVIFGDMIFKEISGYENIGCINGIINLNGSIMGLRFESDADCRKAKLINCREKNDQNGEQVRIAYSKYFTAGDILVPSNITLITKDYNILIKIKKMEIPWEGNFNFIPGNQYEAIPLK